MGFEFFLFMGVGFLAQVVDGALGMAYGVISSSVLLAFGVPPAHASASVHAAEVFTTAASATSHMAHRNIDWKLFWSLAPAGIAGGVLGAYILTSVDSQMLRPAITAYLTVMGVYILYRAWRARLRTVSPDARIVVPLGVVGGLVDATGGGGWGPVVTSTLVGSGGAPRYVIGTVSAVEFCLTTSISIAFLVALLTGHWEEAATNHFGAVAGLIVGGVLAAPFAGFIARHVETRALMVTVGVLVIALGAVQMWQMFAR